MSLFESLVDQYMGRTPAHFDMIAARLRNGQSPLSVRRGLEAEYDLTRLQAGKMVQSVERAIKAWRVCLGTGVGMILVALLLISPLHPFFWGLLVFGVAQTVAGMRGMHAYQQATDPHAADEAETANPAAERHE